MALIDPPSITERDFHAPAPEAGAQREERPASTGRRRVLAGLVAAVAVAGFDPVSRRWVAQADARNVDRRHEGPLSPLPPLDGEVITDPALLATFADDFGHLVSRTPVAVLLPGSVGDVMKMVRYARQHHIRIAARGAGHTMFGQSQAQAGLVIDVGTLNQIIAIGPRHAVVEAGVVWRDLLQATIPLGRTPPVLPDYTALTVGGTLSVGGIGGTSYQHGAQVDNVRSLRVVTGEGELVECSMRQNRDLFDAALGGLGLCAIIVGATLELVPARQRARTYRVVYPDLASMLRDLRVLTRTRRFEHLIGKAVPQPGGFAFEIEFTAFYDAPAALPTDPYAGLDYVPGSEGEVDRTYFEFTDFLVQISAILIEFGLWQLPHPWLDLFVADDRIEAFAADTIAQLDPAQLLPSSILLFYPLVRARLRRPLLRVPDASQLFLFDIARTIPDVPAIKAAVLAQNRALYEANRRQGGRFYPIGAVPMNRFDWRRHFAPEFDPLARTKRRYDPGNVLGAGVDVF